MIGGADVERHIRIFGTPDAKRENMPYEYMQVLDESKEGVFGTKGKGHYIFVDWQYLSQYGYRYIEGGKK